MSYNAPAAGMSATAWLESKTSRLLSKILADRLMRPPQERHRNPAAIDGHPAFSTVFKKGYMTRNLDALTKPTTNPTSTSTNNNKLDISSNLGGLGSKEYWNRKVEEVSIQEPVFLLDKRELMTINSRPPSVASPGLVHVARYWIVRSYILLI